MGAYAATVDRPTCACMLCISTCGLTHLGKKCRNHFYRKKSLKFSDTIIVLHCHEAALRIASPWDMKIASNACKQCKWTKQGRGGAAANTHVVSCGCCLRYVVTAWTHSSNIKELLNLLIISSGNAWAYCCAHKGPGSASEGTGAL